MNQIFKTKKFLTAVILLAVMSSYVAGTMSAYTVHSITARETFAYKNPVTIDIMKIAPDTSLLAGGWTYLGQVNGRYHYQFHVASNHIQNPGQNWQNSYLTGSVCNVCRLGVIGLGVGAYGSATDPSLPGGDLTSGGLVRVSAQATLFNAAAGGSMTFTFVNTFTCLTATNNVDLAGLYAGSGASATVANQPTLWAETTFAAVNLASGDTLTITWTITTGGA